MPRPEQFESPDHYYGVLMHEIAHASGHPDRLDRETLVEGLKDGARGTLYAKEELRAEMAGMMIGETLGIGYRPNEGAAYVEGWLKALEDDPAEIRRAAGDALRIATWVTGHRQATKEAA